MLRKIMEIVRKNDTSMKIIIAELKDEVLTLKKMYIEAQLKVMAVEKSQLIKEIQAAKDKLIRLEILHGKKQIPVPVRDEKSVPEKPTNNTKPEPEIKQQSNAKFVPEDPTNIKPEPEIKQSVQPVTKKEKTKPKLEKKATASEPAELPIDVGRLDLRIGQIMEVEKHPDADSLYVSKIQCGDPALRTVVSGLVKFVPIDQLKLRKVVVLCNLKPVKMRGVNSEAMVMCASTPEKVEVLIPPENAEPGDLIECDGYKRQPDAQLNPKKKIFETVAPDLKTNNLLQACYKGAQLIVQGKGPIVTKSLKNVNIK